MEEGRRGGGVKWRRGGVEEGRRGGEEEGRRGGGEEWRNGGGEEGNRGGGEEERRGGVDDWWRAPPQRTTARPVMGFQYLSAMEACAMPAAMSPKLRARLWRSTPSTAPSPRPSSTRPSCHRTSTRRYLFLNLIVNAAHCTVSRGGMGVAAPAARSFPNVGQYLGRVSRLLV